MNYEYYSDEYGFTFLFKRKNYDKINKQNDKINDSGDKINGNNDKIKSVKTTKTTTLDDKILLIISEDSSITIPKIAERVQKSEATVYRHIEKLISDGKIERVGSRKSGSWKVC